MGNDRVFIRLAALGRYRFVAQPDARRTYNPAERISTILGNGVEIQNCTVTFMRNLYHIFIR